MTNAHFVLRRARFRPAAALGALLLYAAPPALAPARADLNFGYSPFVVRSGVAWSAACSPSLGRCEVQSEFVSLRRASGPGSGWAVSLKAGTATAPPRVEEVRVRAECDCSTVVLTVGESLKAVERPDLLTITDSAKASAVLNLLVKSQGKEVFVRYWSPGWDEESVNTRGLADALTWVDRQQGRTDADRSGAVIDPDTPAIPASMVTDTDAFTDPERTSKELPAPVRKLFARDLRRGCRPHSTDPNRPYFDAHWVERQRVVFFVECTRPDLGPTHRVYTATGPTYEDARVLELEQWDERVLRSGKAPRVRRAVPTSPMFEPAETLVLLHRRDDIKSCYIEHTYRWLEGGYRLLAVRASECPRVVGGVREGERTLRFRVPAEQQ